MHVLHINPSSPSQLKRPGETVSRLPSDCHWEVPVTTMSQKYHLPGLFSLDVWPVGPSEVVVTNPDVAFHMTVTRNHEKHVAESWAVDQMMSRGNIDTAEGSR